MRVVLDTNVLLAALISPHGPPDTIYRAWRRRQFELVSSNEQISELRRASRYPKLRPILPPHRAGALINPLQFAVRLVEPHLPLPDGIALADPADEYLLATALAAEAGYLVTGDRRSGLLRTGEVRGVKIVTPAEFCAQVLDD